MVRIPNSDFVVFIEFFISSGWHQIPTGSGKPQDPLILNPCYEPLPKERKSNLGVNDMVKICHLKHRRHLGEAVRAKRKAAEFSQEKLAEKANLSAVFISRIERGVESPSVDNLVKIAKALGVQVSDLVAGF